MERWRQKIFSPAAMRTNNVLFITIWSPPPCGPAWPHSLQTSDTRIREMPAAHLPMRGERPLAISTEPDPASGLVEARVRCRLDRRLRWLWRIVESIAQTDRRDHVDESEIGITCVAVVVVAAFELGTQTEVVAELRLNAEIPGDRQSELRLEIELCQGNCQCRSNRPWCAGRRSELRSNLRRKKARNRRTVHAS